MKNYEKPYIDIIEHLTFDDIIMKSGINFNDNTLSFDIDIAGGDERW